MYSRNSKHERRKLNYGRYKKLTESGYSISEDTANTALYYINEDPFGRTYYQKSLGEVVIRDPLTGREYTQEEWATKEFIVDNKTQLVNKVSADLVVGKKLTVQFPEVDKPSEELVKWLENFLKIEKFPEMIYESAIRNSSLGDQYYELSIEDDKIVLTYIDPYFVDIETKRGKVQYYEIAWEIEVEMVQTQRILFRKTKQKKTYIQKKIHYPGMIRWELYEVKGKGEVPIPLNRHKDNIELVERAIALPHMKAFMSNDVTGKVVETKDVNFVYIVEEKTGVDVPLLIHWPNYRMFDIFGVSDAGMIENLQNALNNRQTQLNDVLDKHADPPMYGDDSYMDNNGNIVMTGGGGRYFPVVAGGTPPGYLEWQGHLGDVQIELERLYRAILDNTETAAALLGIDKGGTQSGRALMYKLIRSLCMAARKSVYMKNAIYMVVETAQKLKIVWINGKEGAKSFEEPPRTEWEDVIFTPEVTVQSSIPTDTDEIISQVIKLVKDGVITKETALTIVAKLFEEIDVEEEKKKLKEQAAEDIEKAKKMLPDLLQGIPDDNDIPKKKPAIATEDEEEEE